MKILIVEDDSTTVVLIRAILGELKWQMRSTPSLEEAFAVQNEFKPDVIILDLGLSDSSSEETLESIPRLAAQSALIVHTGYVDATLVAEALKRGADDCLDKNSLKDSGKLFIKAIRSALERFQRRSGSSKKDTKSLELQVTQAERKLLNELPSMSQQVKQLYHTVFEGNGTPAITVTLGKLEAIVTELRDTAKSRTLIVILAVICQIIVAVISAITGHQVQKIEIPAIQSQ